MPYDTICREIFLNGFYEKYLLLGMCELVGGRAGTVLDIGANIGNHTVFFSGKFERVISFEPVQRNCWVLKANLHLNDIKNVVLVEKGLGDKNEVLRIEHDDARNTNNGLSELGASEMDNLNKVDVVVGDEELERLGYMPPILMMKIDVEGYEPQVITGLRKTILEHKPIIYWEAFTKETVDQSRVILESFGYEHFYHLSKNRFSGKLRNRLNNAFGYSVYLMPLDECDKFDGMNVASPKELF